MIGLFEWLNGTRFKNKPESRSTPAPARRRFGIELLEDRLVPTNLADLALVSVTPPLLVAPNQDIAISYTVKNLGTAATPAINYLDEIFLSTDNTLDANDVPIGVAVHNDSIAVGASVNRSLTAHMPTNTANGIYQVIVVTDQGNTLADANRSNNSASGSLGVIQTPVTVTQVNQFVGQFQSLLGNGVHSEVGFNKGALTLTLSADSNADLHLLGFKVQQLNFSASLAGDIAGTGSAKMLVNLPGVASPATVAINLSFSQNKLTVDGSLAVANLTLGGTPSLLFVKNGTLTAHVVSDFSAGGSTSGTVGLTTSDTVLLPTTPVAGQNTIGSATLTGPVSAKISSQGVVTIQGARISATVNHVVTIDATGATVTFGPGIPSTSPLVTVSTATVTVPLSGKNMQLKATNLKIGQNGQFTIDSATLQATAGIAQTLGIGGVLPFDVNTVSVKGLNNAPIRLDQFDVQVSGKFNFSIFDSLPAQPILRIGASGPITKQANTFNLTFRVELGAVKIQQTGAITLGFSGLHFDPLTLGATVTLGGFVDGQFVTTGANAFAATFDVKSAADTLNLGNSVAVTGGVTTVNGTTTLSLDGSFTTDFSLPGGIVQVKGAKLNFHLGLQLDTGFQLVGKPTITLQGLSVAETSVKFGGVLTMKANNGVVHFNAAVGQPVLTVSALTIGVANPTTPDGASAGVTVGGNFGILADGSIVVLSGVNLQSFGFNLPPITLGDSFEIHGGLTLAIQKINNTDVLVGRIIGGFNFQDIKADIDLVVTQFGPVLATVTAPLAVPIGPSGLVLSGVTGGIIFGSTIPDVQDPLALIGPDSDPRFQDPLKQANAFPGGLEAFIASKVSEAITSHTNTLQTGFTLILSGQFTHVAAPGTLSANLTLGTNVNLTHASGASTGVKFLGFGDLVLQGFSVGDAKVILDLTDPLAPKLSAGFQTPTPGSPLAALLPNNATFVAQIDTKGLVIGTVIGVRTFVDRVVSASLASAQGFFDDVLNRMADRIVADPTRPLGMVVLDANGDGILSAAEKSGLANPTAFRQTFRTQLQKLLPASFKDFSVGSGQILSGQLAKLAKTAQAFLGDFTDAVAAAMKAAPSQNFASFTGNLAQAVRNVFDATSQPLLAFAGIIQKAVADAATAAGDQIDPSLLISGKIQPTIFGIPFGTSKAEGTVVINKSGLLVQTTFNVLDLISLFEPGAQANILLNSSLPVTDKITATIKLPFGDVFPDLAKGNLPALNPVDGKFLIGLQGQASIEGFQLNQVSGTIFRRNDAAGLAQLVQIVDANGDGIRDAAVIPGRIQIADTATFNKLVANGGVLLDGLLTVPKLISDPADVITRVVPPLQTALGVITTSGLPSLQGIGNTIRGLVQDPQNALANPNLLQTLITQLSGLGQAASVAAAQLQIAQTILNEVTPLSDVQLFIPNLLDAGANANAAYFTGDVTGKLFGLPLTNATISAANGTLRVNATIPLVGMSGQFVLDRGSNGRLRAGGELTLTTAQLQSTLTNLGVPAGLFSDFTANAKLRLYSPGFDPISTDALKQTGGIELTAGLSIVNLVNNTNFLFRITPSATGTVPNFVASAHVPQLNIPGLNSSQLTLGNYDLHFTKSGNALSLHVNGGVNLFGSSAKAEGDLQVGSNGVFGFVRLTNSNGTAFQAAGENGFQFNGDFYLLVNTTGTTQSVTINGRTLTVAVRSGRLHVEGGLTMAGYSLTGRFDLLVGTNGLDVTSDASLTLGQFGVFRTTDHFTINSSGISASIALSKLTPPNPLFDVSGNFVLNINVQHNGAPSVAVSVTNGVLRLDNDFSLTGSMTIGVVNGVFEIAASHLHTSLFHGAIQADFSGTVRSNGQVNLIASTGFQSNTLGLKLSANISIQLIRSASGAFSFAAFGGGSASYVIPNVGEFPVSNVAVMMDRSGNVTVSGSYTIPFIGTFTLNLSFKL